MNRLIAIASAMLVAMFIAVPVAAAAEPWSWGGRTEQLIIASGTDITLTADQSVDVLVIVGGHARIEGDARAIFVLGGSADLVGSHANGIVAIRGRVTIDGASLVTGDIRSLDSTITGATAGTLTGRIRDIGPDAAFGWIGFGSVLLFFVYLAFVVSVLVAGVLVAGLAGRQVRAASALISDEPLPVVGAAFVGLIGLILVSVGAMITVVGIPFGIALLVLVVPVLFVAGYIVAGIWLGEQILARMTPGVVRERPYLAAAIGLSIVGVVSVLPAVGGLVSFVGLGAVVLLMWRVARRDPAAAGSDAMSGQVVPAAG
jgi:hypothetical protein